MNLSFSDVASTFLTWRAKTMKTGKHVSLSTEVLWRFLSLQTWYRDLDQEQQIFWATSTKKEVYRLIRRTKRKHKEAKEVEKQQQASLEATQQGSLTF
ncbi:hypothetical protein N9L26_01240 [Candidatus Pacebacteria bacterium]|nr:hypothetical protein [Candidatus Paceibacterota bacterium]